MILSPFPCVQAIVVATLAAVTLSACAAGVTVGTPESPPADLKARIASARPLAVENVCEPIRSAYCAAFSDGVSTARRKCSPVT